MKILKFLLVIFVLIAAAFFIVGMVMPKVEYGHEITVNKSVEEAWAVSEDPSKHSLWIDGLESEELISGEKGMPGSKYKVVVNPGEGQDKFEMTETLLERVPNDHVKMHFDSKDMEFGQSIIFTAKDSSTSSIKTESYIKGKSAMMRSMLGLMEIFGNSFQKQEEVNIDKLKGVVDENTTDYFVEVLTDS